MFRFNVILFGLLAASYLLGIYVFPFSFNSRETLHQIFVITGVACWTLMAECMVIAARPRWLEKVFGEPLDKLMGHHKHLGWWMFGMAMAHFFAPIYAWFLPTERVAMMEGGHVMDTLWQKIWIISHPVGALLGIFVSLYMLSIIWRDVKYARGKSDWDTWEKAHRMWAWCFVGLALHSTRLLKETEMIMPLGWFNLIITVIGLWASIRILRRKPGQDLRTVGTVKSVESQGALICLTVNSELSQTTTAGQFAYLSFKGDTEDPHPFTVAGVNKDTGELFFWIKNVGKWTQSILGKKPGDPIEVEGPWGTFLPDFTRPEPTLWVAGGVGIAPFIAWMELAEKFVAQGGTLPPITLWWSVHSMKDEGGVELVGSIAKRLGIVFKVYESGVMNKHLNPEDLIESQHQTLSVCANPGLTKAMKAGWVKVKGSEKGFHSEIY